MISVDDYNEVKDCIYKDEHYSARDNGAVMRHQREGMRKRKLDNVWTFGTPNVVNGYMEFGGERVHRIVATAFHGEAPSNQHVVDHIDTNRKNNRPKNLRWLTKLENALCNEITRKKIEMICGSVEAFLENPSLLYAYSSEDKNFSWMRNVTKEEAKNCLDNWSHWAKTAKPSSEYKKKEKHVDEWIFKKQINYEENPFLNKIPDRFGGYKTINRHESTQIVQEEKKDEDDFFLTNSLTPSAIQRNWRTATEFPCCPSEVIKDGLIIYMNNLKEGTVFSINQHGTYYVVDKGFHKSTKKLVVLSTDNKDEFLSWAISTISIEKSKYVHEGIMATAGKELTEKLFKYMIGQGELTDEEFEILDCL